MNEKTQAIFASAAMLLLTLLFLSPWGKHGQQKTSADFWLRSLQAEAQIAQGISGLGVEEFPLEPFNEQRIKEALALMEPEEKAKAASLTLAFARALHKEDAVLFLAREFPPVPDSLPSLGWLARPHSRPAPEEAVFGADMDLLPLSAWGKLLLMDYRARLLGIDSSSFQSSREAMEKAKVEKIGLFIFFYLLVMLLGMVVIFKAIRSFKSGPASVMQEGRGFFGASPMETAMVFALWLSLSMFLGSVVSLGSQDPASRGFSMLMLYGSQALFGLILIHRLGLKGLSGPGADHPGFKEFIFGMGLNPSDLNAGVVKRALFAFAAALPIVLLLSLLSQILLGTGSDPNPIIPHVLEGKETGGLLLVLVNVLIFAPFFEEVMFRGFILKQLSRFIGPTGGLFLSSIMFAGLHGSLDSFLPLTGLGLLLGVVARQSGNLWTPVLIHALWNANTMAVLLIVWT